MEPLRWCFWDDEVARPRLDLWLADQDGRVARRQTRLALRIDGPVSEHSYTRRLQQACLRHASTSCTLFPSRSIHENSNLNPKV